MHCFNDSCRTDIGCFTLNHAQIEGFIKVIHEGFVDEDDALLVSQLEQAYQTFDANQADMAEPVAVSDEETDPFDAFREMED